MRRRSNPWPSFVDLFMVLMLFAFAALMMSSSIAGGQIEQLKNQVKKLQDEKQQLKEQLAELRSTLLPRCVEKKIAKGPLLTALVRGPDQFEIQKAQRHVGKTFTFVELLNAFEQDLRSARTMGCRHQVELIPCKGVSWNQALVRFQKSFYRISRNETECGES